MTIEEAITLHIKQQPAIVARVASRIYQGEREQSVSGEAISFERIPGGSSFQDISAGSVGLAEDTYSFSWYADSAKEANSGRELLRLAFQNHVGAVMGGAGGVLVYGCLYESSSGGFEPGTEPPKYVRSVDFLIQYEQPTS